MEPGTWTVAHLWVLHWTVVWTCTSKRPKALLYFMFLNCDKSQSNDLDMSLQYLQMLSTHQSCHYVLAVYVQWIPCLCPGYAHTGEGWHVDLLVDWLLMPWWVAPGRAQIKYDRYYKELQVSVSSMQRFKPCCHSPLLNVTTVSPTARQI